MLRTERNPPPADDSGGGLWDRGDPEGAVVEGVF